MFIRRMNPFSALLAVLLCVTGCSGSSSSTHTVSTDQDRFTETVDGRTVDFQNWSITIDGKTIPIEKKTSVIRIDYKGGKVDIFVNGEQVHNE